MKLVFNAESLRPPLTGVGYYSYHLLRQFADSAELDDIHCFTGTRWQGAQEQLAATAASLGDGGGADADAIQRVIQSLRQAVGLIPGTKTVYDGIMRRRFTRHAGGLSDAVYHETNYILKPFDGPCVTTVHDLSHIHYPQHHPRHVVDYLERELPQTLRRADRVITVSEVVREDLLTRFAIAPERVQTIYEGADPQYRPRSAQQTAPVLDSYGLRHQSYVLMVATLEPRKGIDTLLDAWELLPASLRSEFPLVMTGSSGWRNTQLKQRLDALIAAGSVRHLGYVAAARLPLLYAGAAVFTYPSLYEGFGLPVLEAMCSGVPVICRAGTSMAEFSRDACVLCDTPQAEELAARLQALLEDTASRREWATRGLRRAAAFSWERCAGETMALYRQLL